VAARSQSSIAATSLLGLRVRIPLRSWILVFCENCVLYISLRWTNHSSRGVIPSVCHWVWSGTTINLYTYNE